LNADVLSNELNVNVGIDKVKEKFLADLPDAPRWIDGSGLSRYNLFTPRSIVALLGKIHDIVPEERLFKLLPAAGKSGTLRNMMKIDEPFIFAKSGSLSSIYCLSGYLVTKKGKVFIFSIMNNNFTKSTAEIRKEIVSILTEIHQNN